MSLTALKLESDNSSVLDVVEGHKLFLWGMWSIVKRKKIMEIGRDRSTNMGTQGKSIFGGPLTPNQELWLIG